MRVFGGIDEEVDMADEESEILLNSLETSWSA